MQQRNGFRQRSTNTELRHNEIPAGGNATRKLLNLHQLKKTYLNPKPFVLRKPINMSKYDYSVFTEHQIGAKVSEDDELPPPIKESQIRAWESAEKISSNIIFENSRESTSDTIGIYEDGSRDVDSSIDEESHIGDDSETSINRGVPSSSSLKSEDIITSIPGYTKGELKLLIENFKSLNASSQPVNPVEFEDSLANALWVYRQLESSAQERAFMAHHTISGKRKVQVYHKKEFLRKLFGYSNNINEDFITNNTSYSAYDNVANVQKTFHEDKEEMISLLEEDKNFEEMINETRTKSLAHATSADDMARSPLRAAPQPDVNTSHLLDLTLTWLTSNYTRENEPEAGDFGEASSIDHDAGDDEHELVAYTIAHFKKLIKETEGIA